MNKGVNGHMNKNLTKYFIYSLLLVSLVGNVALFFWGNYWKEALANQFISTSDIEQIFIGTDSDISFENIYNIAKSKFGTGVVIIEVGEPYTDLGSDAKAIGVNDTLLLFKDGKYYGSKSFVR
jgi:hypothetical protein